MLPVLCRWQRLYRVTSLISIDRNQFGRAAILYTFLQSFNPCNHSLDLPMPKFPYPDISYYHYKTVQNKANWKYGSRFNNLSRLDDLVSRLYDLVSRLYELVSRLYDLVSRLFDLIARLNDLVSRLYDLASRVYDLASHLYDLVNRLYDLVSCLYDLRKKNVALLRFHIHPKSIKPCNWCRHWLQKKIKYRIDFLMCPIKWWA